MYLKQSKTDVLRQFHNFQIRWKKKYYASSLENSQINAYFLKCSTSTNLYTET